MSHIAVFVIAYIAGLGTALLWGCCRAAARPLPTGGHDLDTAAFALHQQQAAIADACRPNCWPYKKEPRRTRFNFVRHICHGGRR